MKLSEIKLSNQQLQIKRDVEFDVLGMTTSIYKHNEKVLVFVGHEKFLKQALKNENVVALIVTSAIYLTYDFPNTKGIIVSDSPKQTFMMIHESMINEGAYLDIKETKISSTSKVSNHAIIADTGVTIGERCLIESGVVIHSGVIIGDDVIIRSGSQIGTNGFQYNRKDDIVETVETGGFLVIEDHVEIQHNCCVDKGIFGGRTYLGPYVKLDNFVHIGHDNYIGDATFLIAGVKLAGRVTIGEQCFLGLNSTVSNGISIGHNVKVGIGSVVIENIDDNGDVAGNFAMNSLMYLKNFRKMKKGK